MVHELTSGKRRPITENIYIKIMTYLDRLKERENILS